MKKPELLAPAGNLEKLKIAIDYGADAVYCGGHNYGLRSGADNFTIEDLKEGTKYAHANNSNIYITVNMMPHNHELEGLPKYLHELEEIGVDSLIVSDPGVLNIIKEEEIKTPIHLSTQANTVNWASANFWQKQGVERVILARELSKEEISEFNNKSTIEKEMFIHGSMCISYSGRCLLSNYMVGRDANRGQCAHSCRWKYHLVEEKRPGEYYPIYEDESGSYIMNSKDLNLIEYIRDIMELNLSSLKIEGRMKSIHYVATVVGVYRKAIDEFFKDPENYKMNDQWLKELKKVSNRGYTTGFFNSKPDEEDHNYESSAYRRRYDFMGVVKDYNSKNNMATIEVRNKIFKGDNLEFYGPGVSLYNEKIDYIINSEGEKVDNAPHPKELIKLPVNKKLEKGYIVRRKKEDVNNE
ncbi:MAG: peptidase U32 family protein [Bacillota bacterium]